MNWKDYNADKWESFKIEAIQEKKKGKTQKIIASDIRFKEVETIIKSLDNIGAKGIVEILQEDFFDLKDDVVKPSLIIMNPPYGERIVKTDLKEFYRQIGNSLKTNYVDCEAWIISSALEELKFVGLKPSKKIALHNGALECKFQKYELYSGSKKVNYNEEDEEE
jgi:putative N6-adenine-specific DNA methylase